MNWDAIGAIGEIIGAAAVIATLIYLAKQVKDNSREVRLGSIISINHLINEAWEPIYNNDRNIRIWVTGQQSPSELDSEDEAVFSLFMARLVNVLLTAFSQNRYESLDSEEFQKYAGTMKSLLETPGGKAWLERMGGADLMTPEALLLIKADTKEQRSMVAGGAKDGA